MKELPAGIRTSMSENDGCTEVVDNASQRDIAVLSHESSRERNNNFVTVDNCESLIPQLLSNQLVLSAHGGSITAMSDQPFSGPNEEGYTRDTARVSLSNSVEGSMEGISQDNVHSILLSGSAPGATYIRSVNADQFMSPSVQSERADQPVNSVSQSAHAITVLSPSIEKSLKDRSFAHRTYQSRHSVPRRARGIPGVSSSGDLSKLLTLDEDEELTISSTARSEMVDQSTSPSRISPAMMGRRHSMDSNIGRSRPPTFVRTYREVKWKRVSKPSKLRQLPRTPSADNLTAVPGGTEDEEESREYISGTHIIRQRVPIFMTSRDPPDPMGRRFSAGDLIPVTGQGRNWTPSGKCLVIGDVVPSKLVHASSSDDSSSSSTEDVRVSQSSDGSGNSSESDEHDEAYEFSLIDEDDDDDGDLTAGSEEDENVNKQDSKEERMTTDLPTSGAPCDAQTTNSSTDASPASAQKVKAPKHLDLRRLALVNSLQKKTTVRPGTTSNRETIGSSPRLPSSATAQLTANPTSGVLETAHSGMMSSATDHSTAPITDPLNETTSVPSTPPAIPVPPTSQSAFPPSTLQSVTGTQLISLPNTDRQTSTSKTTQSFSEVIPILHGVSPETVQVLPAIPHTLVHVEANHQAVITSTNQTSHSSPTRVPDTIELNRSPSQTHEPSDPHLYSSKDVIVSMPSSLSEMPWVMTSTMIADANVYVSSSHTPNSSMSTRSAHWISPRSVEGTIPINLEDATAIRVETVSVPTSPESEPLHFQKITYSSGFIISSAQWVAPVDTVVEPLASNENESLPLTSSQRTEPATGTLQTPTIKKSRKKYVAERAGTILRPVLSYSDVLDKVKRQSPADRSAQRLEVTGNDDRLNANTACIAPSSLDSSIAGAFQRQFKRKFHVDKVVSDHFVTTEVELCAQLEVSSISQSLSPTKSKRRFVVEKVPDDLLPASLPNLNDQPPKLDTDSSLTQITLDSALSEICGTSEYTEETEPDLQRQSLLSQHSESSGPDSTQHAAVPGVTHRQLSVPQSTNTSDIISQDMSLEHHAALHSSTEPAVSSTCSELATQLRDSCTTVDSTERRLSSGKHTKLRIDTEDDERFAKENDALLQMILTTISDTKEVDSPDNNNGGGSTVAIDNKIEQAMDLVKRHLMYAVREEVEILKQQIGEMMDRIGQLEYENTVLRSEAKPETLNKLLQPRLTQPQTALPTQPQTASITAAPTQQPAISQIQPPQQQQQTTVSQVGQPPSTT